MGTTEPRPDTGSAGQKRSPSEVDQLVALMRRFGETTGKQAQYQQADALGVPSSSFSRWLKGEVPSERTFTRLLQHVQLSEQERVACLELRQRAADASGRRETSNGDHPRPATSTQPHRWLAVGITLATILISVTVIVLVNRQPAPDDRQPEQPEQSCDRYEVTADTLAIRSANGEQTGEFYAKGQQLDIQRRTGSAGAKYWYVIDDKGREGWVLPSPNWWHPVC